ncbi:hypothetical protein RhiXN_02011 [Rhizoctonia solani]|uniref:Uncharacterized protein n=1 Tax=Rhizoctonia solani TaxID=456999 RepID=A0A8H8T2E1_9AGAM|nr:uncharacterized protein RhiXN_02011 [Rhizoctonia solani]QRW27416.1 hypothetical protein RhiXN_02011 [Rhizoctonia solani]
MTPPAPKRSRTAPKFHSGHLDPNRARKLKKEWIAHQKLKARYRAEKRRMGMTKVTAEDDGDEAGGSTGDDIAKADESDSHSDSPVNDSSAEVADTAAQSPVVDSLVLVAHVLEQQIPGATQEILLMKSSRSRKVLHYENSQEMHIRQPAFTHSKAILFAADRMERITLELDESLSKSHRH